MGLSWGFGRWPARPESGDGQVCISCGKCARVCRSFIKVDQVRQVVSTASMFARLAARCLWASPGEKKRVSRRIWVLAILLVFRGTLVFFRTVGPWRNNLTTEEYRHHVERINGAKYTHPGR